MMPTEISLHNVDSLQIVTNRKSDGGYWLTLKVVQEDGHYAELSLWPKGNDGIAMIIGETE